MTTLAVLASIWLVLEWVLKIIAIGVVPEDRDPGSSSAWLLAIFFIPIIGVPLYLVIGSPWVRGRRSTVQDEANNLLAQQTAELPDLPPGVTVPDDLAAIVRMNRSFTGLPCVNGVNEGVYGDTTEAFAAMAAAVEKARDYAHVEFYITSWDHDSDPVLTALVAAAARGVKVRLLMDHLGSRPYPGFKDLQRKLTDAGIEWHLSMPIQPLKGRWRRPDLRNHRKLLVIDGTTAFVGSHNLIGPAYGSAKNAKIGRGWKDLSMCLSGQAVVGLDAVFATDWYIETGEWLDLRVPPTPKPETLAGDASNAMQVVCSGPGFRSEPNLRMFVSLVYLAQEHVSITSPYFVPDDALLQAMTSAAYRGVKVDLFVGAQADQFVVGHAQRSYYSPLLESGVRIYQYPAPTVLHAKYLSVDGTIGVLGSSNMDYRSNALNYEVMMLGFNGDLARSLAASDAEYRAISHELTLQEWRNRPLTARYLDNVCRLASSLM